VNRQWKIAAIISGSVVIMFIVGYLIAVRVLFPPLPEPEDGIVVPALTGFTVAQAQERLRPLGLRVTEVTSIEHPTETEGVVIAQSPLAGQQLREMGEVRLAVSAGPPVPEPVVTPPSPE
jgi:hypothetical protein